MVMCVVVAGMQNKAQKVIGIVLVLGLFFLFADLSIAEDQEQLSQVI